MTIQLNEKQKENILNQCNIIAGSREITAVSIYGPWVCEYADEKTDVNVLMILDSFNYPGVGKSDLMYVVAVEVHKTPTLKVFEVNTFAARQDVQTRS